METKKKLIVVKFQYEAVHQWKECDIKEVSFLKEKHRHIFYFEVHKEVTHNNRDIEIIMFKRNILHNLDRVFLHDFKNMSCEDIAEYILNTYKCDYVQVLEDNENGAIVKI
jgi:hypothetical protein